MSRPVVAIAFPLVILAGLMASLAGGFTDDGFIHIQYASNLIERGEYSFNAGEVSFGTTSPLWVMTQAAIGKAIGGGERLIASSRLLSWVGGFLCVVLVFVLARRVGLSAPACFACALVTGAHAWLARWAALGMETSTAVAAICAVGIFSVAPPDDRRQAMLLGFSMAVAALLRPEAYLIAPVLLAAAASRRTREDGRAAVIALLVYAALVVPWLVFAKLHIGSMLPNTAGAKSGGLVLDPILFFRKLEPIAKIVGAAEAIPLVLLVSGVVVARRRSRSLSRKCRVMLFWIVALPVAYVALDIQVLSRYMLLVTPFVVVLGFAGLEDWLDRVGRRGRGRAAIVTAAAVATAAVNIVFFVAVVLPPSRAFSRNLTHELRDLALDLRERSPEDAVVAAADIGYLAFYSRRYVLDLGGLVDRETHDLREAHTYEEIVEKGLFLQLASGRRPNYFIDRELVPERFDGAVLQGVRFERVRTDRIENLGIRKPGPYYYTLYRLSRNDHE